MLQANALTLGYQQSIIIDNLTVTIPDGEITVLIGANGCGKSTFLRALARLLKPKAGDITLNDKSIQKWSNKEIAKQLAILPQTPIAPESITVLQLVKQGRYPHQNWRKQWSKKDEVLVQKALEATGTWALKDRMVESLSGGQRQRVWIAMTLAQDTPIILLDEPTTYLDVTHQIDILDLLFERNQQDKCTIVMVLHDLNLACRYAHHLIAIKDKQIYAQGTPEAIITEETVQNVFELPCTIIPDPLFGTPLCIPYGKGRKI